MGSSALAERLTSSEPNLDRAEVTTTLLAVVTSSALYLRQGTPYLSRGVVGDLAGFGVLGAVLVSSGNRLRHEAFVCMASIGVVLSLRPDWPLRVPQWALWSAVSAGLASYLGFRGRRLAGR